jgi:hypothetical protein
VLDITSREDLYASFDRYTLQRKEELNRRSLKPGTGLLKTYVIETDATAKVSDIVPLFKNIGWNLQPIDEALYTVRGLPNEMNIFLDILTPRYLALYTTTPTETSDTIIKQAVRDSVALDHAWFSSAILNTIWKDYIENTLRDGVLHYENEPLFERFYNHSQYDELTDAQEQEDIDDEDDDLLERRVPRLEVRQRITWLRERFGEGAGLGDLTGNLVRIRIPATNQRGRYEYYHWGKATNRGSEFIGFRSQLNFLVRNLYGQLTRLIEETCAFYLEHQTLKSGSERWSVRGAPVTFLFNEPLSHSVLKRFVELTFERGRGPFRLWGNPIWLNGPKVHVYGLDLHLWQQIYLDMSPQQFTLVLPQGTCGNTVHRLATNVQRYLDPRVHIFIGETPYTDLIYRAMRS